MMQDKVSRARVPRESRSRAHWTPPGPTGHPAHRGPCRPPSSHLPELRYTPCTRSGQEMRGGQTREAVPTYALLHVHMVRPSSWGLCISDPRHVSRSNRGHMQ
jgi:hypothetical protein